MVAFLRGLPEQIQKPDNIIVISAHWEESETTIIGHESPALFYDYYGFPEEAYELKYPAPGNPGLAGRIQNLLEEKDISASVVNDRGFDHGVFIPLKLMYPDADIPVVQLSLIRGLNPDEHLSLGRALHNLIEGNVLIIGSGLSFHNMSAFSWESAHEADSANDEFQDWLILVCTGEHSQAEREKMLSEWDKAPYARYCHPREEHLIPLHVCCGMSGEKADVIFDDYILGKRTVAFRW